MYLFMENDGPAFDRTSIPYTRDKVDVPRILWFTGSLQIHFTISDIGAKKVSGL